MLRYKTETRPGLVALYDIRPGNGAGPFLQPWSPHGAGGERVSRVYHPHQNITGHLTEQSSQSATCSGDNNVTRTTERQKTNTK